VSWDKAKLCNHRIHRFPTDRRLENKTIDPSHCPSQPPSDLRRDRIAEEDTPTGQALERIPLALLTPTHRLEATRNVKGITSLGSDQTCADRFLVGKLASVAHELATESLSPVSRINHKEIQRPILRTCAGPVVGREWMRAFEDVCFGRVGCAVFGFVCLSVSDTVLG